MTVKEAIRELEYDKELYNTDAQGKPLDLELLEGTPDGLLVDALDMAIEALKAKDEAQQRQTPQPVIYQGDGYADGYMVYDTWECPCCGKQYDVDGIYKNWKHCPECGQAIDWSEQEGSRMSMISEQIKEIEAVKHKYELQNINLAARVPTEHDIKAISGAISTIKDLSAKLRAASMERSSQYYNGGWIPTSERLPCDREWYLVTCQEPDTGFIGVPFIGDYLNGKHTKITTDDGWILRGFTDWDDTPIYDYYKKLKVIAYAPLPERYKPKESEKNHD